MANTDVVAALTQFNIAPPLFWKKRIFLAAVAFGLVISTGGVDFFLF